MRLYFLKAGEIENAYVKGFQKNRLKIEKESGYHKRLLPPNDGIILKWEERFGKHRDWLTEIKKLNYWSKHALMRCTESEFITKLEPEPTNLCKEEQHRYQIYAGTIEFSARSSHCQTLTLIGTSALEAMGACVVR